MDNQRKLLLRGLLLIMSQLRSPHTVNVYGAIISQKDRPVFIMELMQGGDLRTLLQEAEERLLGS